VADLKRSAKEIMTHRASICISSDAPEEELAFETWLEQWKGKMTYISDDYGCGCCVHLCEIEGPKEGIDALPKNIRSKSDWSETAVQSHP
jgi:hypothetical protein